MEWILKLILLFVAVVANSWFWTSFTNRLYSLPIPSDRLDRIRIAHDLGMIFVPVWLAISLFWNAENFCPLELISLSSTWPVWRTIPWLFAAVGALGLTMRFAHRTIRKLPEGYEVQRSEIIHLDRILGEQCVGEGKYASMISFPGNQQFEPELNEKRFCFDRLPREWKGVKVLHISDVHFLGAVNLPFYEYVFRSIQEWKPDIIFFTGDLLDNPEHLDWIDSTFGRLSAPLGCYYILGNHDWHLDCEPIHQKMREHGWSQCTEQPQEVTHNGASVAIAGDERPWMGTAPRFDESSAAFKILLSHTPDNIGEARKQQVDLMLSGHNHGGQIKLPILGPVYSPSWYGVRYADGVFYEAPTTLHVSRGLAGKHPLRISCRPEVTLLTLDQSEKSE